MSRSIFPWEGLPKAGQRVLFHDVLGKKTYAGQHVDAGYWLSEEGLQIPESHVAFWMPMPDAAAARQSPARRYGDSRAMGRAA
jgi:hypothetical protein